MLEFLRSLTPLEWAVLIAATAVAQTIPFLSRRYALVAFLGLELFALFVLAYRHANL